MMAERRIEARYPRWSVVVPPVTDQFSRTDLHDPGNCSVRRYRLAGGSKPADHSLNHATVFIQKEEVAR